MKQYRHRNKEINNLLASIIFDTKRKDNKVKNPVKIQFLSEEERERIFQGALEILEEVGVEVEDEILCKKMLEKGCIVNDEFNIIKVEKDLVKKCIKDTNKKPILKCINGKELHLYENNRYYGSLIIDPFVLDYHQGVRKPVLEDVIRHAKLGDALPLVDQIYKMDELCSDVDPRIADLKTIEAFVSNTTTSLLCAPASMNSLKIWVDISEIIAGGNLFDNPILTCYVSTVSPLFLTKSVGEQIRYCIEKGVILRGGPCQIAGATSPYSLAGCMVQGVAEMLFLLVAAQSVKKGVPFVVGIGGHNMDMKTGTINYGGPVKDILHIVGLEIAEYLGLPSNIGPFSTLCPNYGIQNGVESSISAFLCYFSKVQMITGMGSIGNACGVSPEQILIHCDIVKNLQIYSQGIKVNDELLGIDSIKKVGPRGNFLTDNLTMKYLKSGEHYLSEFCEVYRPGWDKKEMIEKVHQKVEEIINFHKPKVNTDRVSMVNNYVKNKIRQIIG